MFSGRTIHFFQVTMRQFFENIIHIVIASCNFLPQHNLTLWLNSLYLTLLYAPTSRGRKNEDDPKEEYYKIFMDCLSSTQKVQTNSKW